MPDSVVDPDVIRDAVRLACRAPSLHNSQPWHWVAENSQLQLFGDPERVVRATDVSGREALLSCGAVLDHLRVAMAAAGWTTHADRFPNPNNSKHLASIDFSPMEFTTEGHRRRADAILARRTDRLPFAAPPDWVWLEGRLRDRDDAEPVRLDVIADESRPQLAEASRLTESLRLYDSSYHAELQWWTAAYAAAEGIPHNSLVSAAESARVDVGRTFPVTHHAERRTAIGADHSTILVLSTYDASPTSTLQCGEMLSAVLLDATMAGLATCPLTHMTELAASRNIVAGLIGRDALPQVLIRVGLAPAIDDVPPPTPRRTLEEVLEIRSGTATAGADPAVASES